VKSLKVSEAHHGALKVMAALCGVSITEQLAQILEKETKPYANIRIRNVPRKQTRNTSGQN
jgi:hypothetical protein